MIVFSISRLPGGSRDSILNQYTTSRLDWFALDLEGEHSAVDGQILEEHTEYVLYAIDRILDQYKESRDARAKEGAVESGPCLILSYWLGTLCVALLLELQSCTLI